MKNNFDSEFIKKIKNILLKKSEGYFYDEEVKEYQIIDDINTTKNQSSKEPNIENNNEKSKQEKDTNLILIKKKVTTHYVPPDLLALKMLLENFGEKINSDDLSLLSDKELLDLKNQLIKNIEEN